MPQSHEQSPEPFGFPAPLRYTQLLAWGARLYWAELGRVVPLFFVGYLLVTGSRLALLATRDLATPVTFVSYVFTVLALTIVGSLLVVVAAIVMAGSLTGNPPSSSSAVASLRGRIRDVVGGALFLGIIAVLVNQVLFPFGPVFVYLLLGPPVVGHVIAFERKHLQAAWARSKALLAGHTGRVFAFLFSVSMLIFLVLYILGLPAASLLADQIGGAVGVAAYLILASAAAAILLPYLAAVSFVIYLDLRARLEDFDVGKLRVEPNASET